jgi:hypothetical protein
VNNEAAGPNMRSGKPAATISVVADLYTFAGILSRIDQATDRWDVRDIRFGLTF